MKRTKLMKKLIEDTGMNLKAFSRKAGLPYTTLRSMLSRPMGNAAIDNVVKVCRTLGITVEDLQSMADNDEVEIRPSTIAVHLDGIKLSEEESKELNNFVEFLLYKRKK